MLVEELRTLVAVVGRSRGDCWCNRMKGAKAAAGAVAAADIHLGVG